MKDLTTLLRKRFTNSKTGVICTITAVDEENRRVTAEIDGELKDLALGTLKGSWRKSTVEEIASLISAQAEQNGQDTPTEPQDVPSESETVEIDTSESKKEKPSTELMQMSEVVAKLETCFDLLNGLYFEGRLPWPVITVQSTPKFYGHCSTKRIWKAENDGMYEINIGAEFVNLPMENIAATLCHEMVHLYCRENNVKETCQNGRYHNKVFKNEAEARDLIIDYDRANGYTHTTPSEEFKQKLHENDFDLTVRFARIPPMKKAVGEREKAHKYVCPLCGQEVKTTAELNLICGECEVPMTRQD